jgi:hypothetical protein
MVVTSHECWLMMKKPWEWLMLKFNLSSIVVLFLSYYNNNINLICLFRCSSCWATAEVKKPERWTKVGKGKRLRILTCSSALLPLSLFSCKGFLYFCCFDSIVWVFLLIVLLCCRDDFRKTLNCLFVWLTLCKD